MFTSKQRRARAPRAARYCTAAAARPASQQFCAGRRAERCSRPFSLIRTVFFYHNVVLYTYTFELRSRVYLYILTFAAHLYLISYNISTRAVLSVRGKLRSYTHLGIYLLTRSSSIGSKSARARVCCCCRPLFSLLPRAHRIISPAAAVVSSAAL